MNFWLYEEQPGDKIEPLSAEEIGECRASPPPVSLIRSIGVSGPHTGDEASPETM